MEHFEMVKKMRGMVDIITFNTALNHLLRDEKIEQLLYIDENLDIAEVAAAMMNNKEFVVVQLAEADLLNSYEAGTIPTPFRLSKAVECIRIEPILLIKPID